MITKTLSNWNFPKMRKKLIKLLSCMSQQCLGSFNILTLLRCPETWLSRHLHKHVFRNLSFRKDISYNIHSDFRNTVKTWEKTFSFLDSFIWIASHKFSQLLGKYFSSGVNVLRNGLEISDITKKDSFQLQFSQNDKKADKTTIAHITVVFRRL